MNVAIATRPVGAKPTRSRSPRRWRVLIVDDIAENCCLLGICCDRLGISHAAVGTGKEAVAAAETGRFDVILMDIFMPGMDGMAATRAIRALPGLAAAMPIIAVTTATEPAKLSHYIECGMTDVVPKPVSASRLAQALSAALGEVRRARRRCGKRVDAEDTELAS
jgi:CheY-like chemotaxis protein